MKKADIKYKDLIFTLKYPLLRYISGLKSEKANLVYKKLKTVFFKN